MLVRGEGGQLLPIRCTDTFTLPATVHGMFLTVESVASRFIDVDFSITFISRQREITHIAESKITVVNAAVPAGEVMALEEVFGIV